MRNLIIFMLLVAFFVLGKRAVHINWGGGVRGEGPVVKEARSVSNFHALDFDISGNAEVQIGDHFSVEVEAQQNLLPLLKTEEQNGTLRVYFDKNISSSENIKVHITAPAFDALTLGGSGDIKVISLLKSENLDLDIAGSGDIYADQLETATLDCGISGSGGLHINGKTNALKVDLTGSGEIEAQNMSSNNCDVEIAGSGTAKVGTVSQTLKAEVTGSGDVLYGGAPSVQSRVTGSGSVEKM